MTTQQPIFIKMALDHWNLQVRRADKLFSDLSDEQLQEEVAPGRNSGIYLLGHLTAVHDALFPLLELGDKLYPQLEDIFIRNPDKPGIKKPAIQEVRDSWDDVNQTLSKHFNRLSPGEWFQKHAAVSAEDFEKELHRNKLNVVLTRIDHLCYHLGQLTFLRK